jgi:hypothetical protein
MRFRPILPRRLHGPARGLAALAFLIAAVGAALQGNAIMTVVLIVLAVALTMASIVAFRDQQEKDD